MVKKKCLITMLEPLGNGGAQQVVISIAQMLNENVDFDLLIFSNKNGSREKEFLSFGGKIYKENININIGGGRISFYIRWIRMIVAIRKVLRGNRYDIIHCHNGLESGILLKEGKKKNIPIRIAHSHVVFDNRGNIIRKIYYDIYRRLLLKNASDLIGCSEIACSSLFGNGKYSVIPNSINGDNFGYMEYYTEKITMIMVASYSENKNQLFSLQVLKELIGMGENATIIMIGKCNDAHASAYFDEINNYIRDYSLSDFVEMLPGDSNVPKTMSKCSYLLFPSKKEGFGIVPVEAQAVGLRCFISDSVPHEVDCGGCTFLPLELGPKNWAERIVADYTRTHGAHKKYDCTKFSTETIMKEYRKLYGVG